MPQAMLARVTCSSCHNQFQTPIEQILDAGADPSAKIRVLNGLVNVAQCPHCGTGGPLGLPFFYHDPDKDLALVYMPMEAGRDESERQRAIGQLTKVVMDSLPPEERGVYLLQPQIFLTLENLTRKILQEDGVTDEMLEEQKAKAELLQRMLDAISDEALEAMIETNDDSIDLIFFQMLNANLELAQSARQEDDLRRLLALRDKLLALSSEGRAIKARSEVMEELRDQPTREKLLELLTQAPDEQMREILIAFGRPLLDYIFFQNLTAQIEAAPDEAEKERLTALRKEVLAVRDRLDEQTKSLYQARAGLLRDLLLSDDPEALARRRAPELDEVFFSVLTANLKEAQGAGDEEAVKALQAVWSLIMRLMDESLPPELRLFNRLMAAEDDAQVERLLQENRDLVTNRMAQFVEKTEANAREDGASEMADRMAALLEKVKRIVAESGVY